MFAPVTRLPSIPIETGSRARSCQALESWRTRDRSDVPSKLSSIAKSTSTASLALGALLMANSIGTGAIAAEYLYSINNDPGQNAVVVLSQNQDGSLTEVAGSPFPTGGKGLGGGDIDQQGAIRVRDKYVLAVNPGSDTVAVFRKGDGGTLSPVAGSPFPAGGPAPLSLTIHNNLVYVANQAPAFANKSAAPNISGFRMDNGGKLTPIANSTITFPAGHGPAQVEFSPGGETVVVTSGFQEVATSSVHGYKVQADGTLKEAAGSPVQVMGASGDVGFSWNKGGDQIYVSNFRGSAVAVFDIGETTGTVKQVAGTLETQGTAACWTALSPDGKTLYVANFVSNSISAFDVSAGGQLTLLGTTKRRVEQTAADTKDMAISKDGKFLYVVGSSAREVSAFSVGTDRTPTELPPGKSPLKLNTGKNILGLASD
jgi:6-phosphogluconolactonase